MSLLDTCCFSTCEIVIWIYAIYMCDVGQIYHWNVLKTAVNNFSFYFKCLWSEKCCLLWLTYRALSTNSALPLSSVEHFNIFQLMALFFYGPQLNCFGSLSLLSSRPFPATASKKSSDKPAYPAPHDWQSNLLVNIVENLAAKEPDISLRS